MKLKRILSTVFLASACVVQAATNDLTALLQKGLFEEEANHNLDAAMQAYQTAIGEHDKDRKLVATAVFRLGECLRKQGKTNEAAVQYERVIREFSDQEMLVKLSSQNVGREALNEKGSRLGTLAANQAPPPAGIVDDELERIKTLIKNSPDLINAGDPTPLQSAAYKGQLKIAEFLLANGAEIDGRGRIGGPTPLFEAVRSGNKAMTEFLLSKGANMQPANDKTPLHLAAEKGFTAIVESLLAHKADPNVTEGSARTPLHVAIIYDHGAVAQLLLANKAEVNAKDNQGETPLHYAAANGKKDLVQLLLEHKADVNARNPYGRTPLLKTRDFEVCKLLVAAGADVEARIAGPNRKGYRSLELAIENGNARLVELLLDNHTDPNASFTYKDFVSDSDYNDTYSGNAFLSYHPLQLTLRNPTKTTDATMLKIIEALLSHGANPNLADEKGNAPLMQAAWSNVDATKLLLDHKADVEGANSDGRTVLGTAVGSKNLKIVEMLCNAGVDLNKPFIYYSNPSPSLSKLTALHLAVSLTDDKMVELLLDHKADVNLLSSGGTAPITWAKNQKQSAERDSIISLLRKAGANENYERLPYIAIKASGDEKVQNIFTKGTNAVNRYTLLELIDAAYSNNQGVPFQDFTSIKIDRVDASGKTSKIDVNLSAILQAADSSKDIWLEWGDVVEIPQVDHKVRDSWPGLSREIGDKLIKCLEREVNIIVKGQTTKITLFSRVQSSFGYKVQGGGQVVTRA